MKYDTYFDAKKYCLKQKFLSNSFGGGTAEELAQAITMEIEWIRHLGCALAVYVLLLREAVLGQDEEFAEENKDKFKAVDSCFKLSKIRTPSLGKWYTIERMSSAVSSYKFPKD